MFEFPHTVILRHRKENLKKCSLRGLESREDLLFFSYPQDELPPLSGYVLLALDAPPLTKEDKNLGIFLIDGTWRYAKTMFESLKKPHLFETRSLPAGFQTAYPRRQDENVDEKGGLASVEALFLAYQILGRNTDGLLDHYHWKTPFLASLKKKE